MHSLKSIISIIKSIALSFFFFHYTIIQPIKTMGRNHTRSADGFYHIHGKKYEMLRGSRAQVFHGTAHKTDGTPGLTKEKLLMNKHGRIVSAKKHATAKREKRLAKHGWTAKKGKFGAVRISDLKKSRKHRKH